MQPKSAWISAAWLGAAAALAGCSASAPPPAAPRTVVVESPQPLDAAGAELFPGPVQARTEADLSFRVPGKIASRPAEMGMRVKAGTLLAVLDPQDARLNLDAARAAVAAAEADLWLAQEEEKRYRELKARGHVGQSAVDQRSNASKLAQARLEQARSQFDLAQNQSSYTRLTADAPGVITQVWGEPGNVVAAGQAVMRFAADGEREVRITVPENRVEALRNAAYLAVEIYNQPGKRYAARLRELSPQASRVTRTHEARVTVLEPDAGVPLGASATVILMSAAQANTFRVPATALGAQPDSVPRVWKLVRADNGDTRVQPVPVKVLQYLDGAAVVSGELSPADRLVTAGTHRLVEDMAVRAIDRAAKAAL